jgi:chloramphenicol-sensitive protein RarD
MNRGILYAVGSCIIWGLLPLYVAALQPVPVLEIFAHRVVGALLLALVLLLCSGQWRWFVVTLQHPKAMLVLTLSATLLAVNWLLYVWAVQSGRVVESSLGYFIAPLMNVVLGSLVLRERINSWQLMAVGLAAGGVCLLSLSLGTIPWLALTLALAFSGYALLRKLVRVSAMTGLAVEMLLLSLPAIGYLIYLEVQGQGHFVHSGLIPSLQLTLLGVFTAILLFLYTASARRLSLATLGVLQYLTPTLQFLLGIFLFHEQLDSNRLLGFSFIWVGLLVYLLPNLAPFWQKARLNYAHAFATHAHRNRWDVPGA